MEQTLPQLPDIDPGETGPHRYRVTFARIGRTHDVEPLIARAQSADELAEQIAGHARAYLCTRHVAAVFDLVAGIGHIVCGVRPDGDFLIEAVS